ncbi:hypothetical protein YC2023_094030 [Brassica napus]
MRLPWIHATLHLVLGCQISYPLSHQKNKMESREPSTYKPLRYVTLRHGFLNGGSGANETARKSQNEDAIYSSRENITRSKLAMVETSTTEAEKYW